jgi:hypothetical protein
MFIRSGIKIEHRIETLDLELVPDHLAMGGDRELYSRWSRNH